MAFVFGLTGTYTFGQKIKTALDMNDHLAAITDSLYAKGREWGDKFNAAAASKDFKSLAPYRQSIDQFIDRKITEIKGLKDIGGSQELRMAMLDFLGFEKKMITTGFKPVENLPADATQEQMQKAIDDLTAASQDESGYLQKVKDAQEAYGKKNGFSITPDKEEDKK
ncbi:hypothetical protein ACTHGU_12525 [Chitinophagaceae bacterium MMS25-I14]